MSKIPVRRREMEIINILDADYADQDNRSVDLHLQVSLIERDYGRVEALNIIRKYELSRFGISV